MDETSGDITALLRRWHVGDPEALTALIPLVYRELHRIAAGYLRRKDRGWTLTPTVLVHEAYLRLIDQGSVDWKGRRHFYVVAAREIRRVLVEQARRRRAQKRSAILVSWDEAEAELAVESGFELLAVDEALKLLEAVSPRQAEVVVLHYFGGLTLADVGEALGLSLSTVERDWAMARGFLFRVLGGAA